MKSTLNFKIYLAALVLAFIVIAPALRAQISVPCADGSDGALDLTSGTNVINLANAITGIWTNSSGSPGNGIYDPAQWAVVFKYSSVNIASNTMLTFTNHPTHAPVVWLVNGNVTINGNLNLDGQPGNSDPLNLPEPGPGGFRGGGGPLYGAGPGFGPGGGNGGGTYYGSYGNPQIIPLIGGSGGSGGWADINGGGGGGAILIAATGTITVNGYCHADGGAPAYTSSIGSGGAIRLVANKISGDGTVEALGGDGGTGAYSGRIRLEANSVSGGLTINPITAGVTPANPATVFPATNAPTVTVYSVAGLTAPSDPKAIMSPSTSADDLTLVNPTAVNIVLQTQNFPTNGTVTVFIKPRNSSQTTLTAAYVSGNTNSALWQVSTTLPYPAHTVIQAHATY
jgi:hypothetical protein